MLNSNEYNDYCKRFKLAEEYLRSVSKPKEETIREICSIREYYPERMYSILDSAGFMYIEDCNATMLKALGDDLALVNSKGEFLLNGRYVFPVRDMLGNTVALIGWFPDEKKYITTPSKMFSKPCLFYGLEQLSYTGIGKDYIVVEGIFDSLSVRSVGIPCVAMMGINSSKYKQVLYSLFKRIVGIPDIDSEGRNVIAKDSWHLPSNGKYFRWVGDSSKDIDKLCNSYEAEDIRTLLMGIYKDKRRVVTARIE